jgi:hypothetical protein
MHGGRLRKEIVPEELFRPQLGEPHHCAYVVEDIEATVNRLVDQLGAGPFFLIENVPLENVLSRDEPAEFVHNSAFGYCGDGAVELIEAVSLAPERVEQACDASLRRRRPPSQLGGDVHSCQTGAHRRDGGVHPDERTRR